MTAWADVPYASASKGLLEAADAKVAGSASRKTSYLIAGAEAGGKLDEARELEVAVLDEAGLMQLLEDGPCVVTTATQAAPDCFLSPSPASGRGDRTATELSSYGP